MRGFSVIALDQPKHQINVGGVLRAAGNYGASMVVLGRPRCAVHHPADTMKVARHKPVLRVDDVFDALPFDCVPVGVDLIDGATPLPEYKHPERAFYIFGAEDATLGARVLGRCRDVVFVPTYRCMNLAATVNVILYDRMAKTSPIETGKSEAKPYGCVDGACVFNRRMDQPYPRKCVKCGATEKISESETPK